MEKQSINKQSFDKDIKTQTESNSKQIADSQLHWFWKLTTKWYFFPVFYTILITLQTIVYFVNKEGIDVLLHPVYLIINTIVFMLSAPVGLSYFMPKTIQEGINGVLIIIFWLLVPISIIKIHKYKSKHDKVLKWLIVTLIIVMLLSFFGFFSGVKITPGY